MKATLALTHLVRHFFLFFITLLLLFSIARAGYNVWQFHEIPDTPTLISSFVTGLRFDLAAIGLILAVPIVLVPLFAMFNALKGLAKFILIFWFLFALLLVMVIELVTPYFLSQSDVRPDMSVIAAIKNPVELVSQLWSSYIVPAAIGIVLVILILISFTGRLEISRMLRFPVKKIPAVCFAIVGFGLCVLAIKSSVDPQKPTLGVDAALISPVTVVNEIALNSSFKSLTNLVNDSGLLKPLKNQ